MDGWMREWLKELKKLTWRISNSFGKRKKNVDQYLVTGDSSS